MSLHMRYDTTSKKWEVSEDGGAFSDLIENPTIEKIKLNTGADPGGGVGGIWYDGADIHISPAANVVGALTVGGNILCSGYGTFGDANFELLLSTHPYIIFDTGSDRLWYDRTNNQFKFEVGGADVFRIPVPACWMTLSGDFTHNSTGNLLKLPTDTVSEDTNSMGSVANTRIQCVTAGVYRIYGYTACLANATGYRELRIYVDGVTIFPIGRYMATTSYNTMLIVQAEIRLAVGQYVELYVYQNSGGNLTFYSVSTKLCLERIRA